MWVRFYKTHRVLDDCLSGMPTLRDLGSLSCQSASEPAVGNRRL